MVPWYHPTPNHCQKLVKTVDVLTSRFVFVFCLFIPSSAILASFEPKVPVQRCFAQFGLSYMLDCCFLFLAMAEEGFNLMQLFAPAPWPFPSSGR